MFSHRNIAPQTQKTVLLRLLEVLEPSQAEIDIDGPKEVSLVLEIYEATLA